MYGRGAIFSPCGTYRYRLWRVWDHDRHPMAVVMLNPSTADAMVDDPTIRRCMAFARRDGAGGIVVVNLFAFRATDPKVLTAAHRKGVDVRGPERNGHLRDAFAVADVVLCAWGAHPLAAEAASEVLALVPPHLEACCLGRTRDGYPRHPLYLAADTPREPYGGHRG
jgi:hypothetical protein